MQSENKIFDDIAKLATGAFGNMVNMKKEIDVMIKSNFEKFVSKMDVVSRDEFEATKEMASKARIEQEKLLKRINELEQKIAELESNDNKTDNGKSTKKNNKNAKK